MSTWDFLKDSDSNLEAMPEEQSSRQLAARSQEPASEAFVVEEIGRHRRTCPTARAVRRMGSLVLVGIGIAIASQWWIKRAQPAMLREAIREATPDLIREVVRGELHKVGIVQDETGWPNLLPKAFAATKGTP